jgi:hypothetical protein
MSYTLHLQKVVKEKGKKTKVNNPCITSLKSYERGKYSTPLPPSFTLKTQKKRREKPHIPHPISLLEILGFATVFYN